MAWTRTPSKRTSPRRSKIRSTRRLFVCRIRGCRCRLRWKSCRRSLSNRSLSSNLIRSSTPSHFLPATFRRASMACNSAKQQTHPHNDQIRTDSGAIQHCAPTHRHRHQSRWLRQREGRRPSGRVVNHASRKP